MLGNAFWFEFSGFWKKKNMDTPTNTPKLSLSLIQIWSWCFFIINVLFDPQSAFYLRSAACSLQSAFYTDRNPIDHKMLRWARTVERRKQKNIYLLKLKIKTID